MDIAALAPLVGEWEITADLPGAARLLIQHRDDQDQPVGDPEIRFTGTIDDMGFRNTHTDQGIVSTIPVSIVNRFTARRVRSGRVLSDSDQKARSAILNPLGTPDRFCERVPLLADKTIVWPRFN